MKSLSPILLAFMATLLCCSLQSCLKDECTQTQLFVEVQPQYLAAEDIRKGPKWETSRELINTGKLYLYNEFLFINERNEGIHVFDNSDPKNPVKKGFISIIGNVDIAIKGNTLYADSYMDFLAIDISNIEAPRTTCRDEDVFTQFWYDSNRQAYLVDYTETDRVRTLECGDPNFGQRFFNDGREVFVDAELANDVDTGGGGGGSSTGVGGSFARFTIAQGHLYAVDQYNLYTYDLERADKPRQTNNQNIGWGIETIFPYEDNLFIGANSGMFIYDASTPGAPRFASNFTHARACDPVFVQGDIAYVTLRGGSRCESFTNQLDIIDVSDIKNPNLIISHDMENPHGLSVRDNHLFICEGIKGIKSFDKSDFNDLDQLDQDSDIHAYDVVSLSPTHLLVVGKGGLYQYEVDSDGKMTEISKITTNL